MSVSMTSLPLPFCTIFWHKMVFAFRIYHLINRQRNGYSLPEVWLGDNPTSARSVKTFTDEAPLTGENHCYLLVEQNDGNMAWSSPVWVQVK